MPRTCSVCNHADRSAIDKALVEGTAYRTIADQFGISKTALIRHKENHLKEELHQAQEQRAEEAVDILKEMDQLRRVALGLLVKAEKSDQLRAAIAALREARETLIKQGELLARQPSEEMIPRSVLNKLIDTAYFQLEYENGKPVAEGEERPILPPRKAAGLLDLIQRLEVRLPKSDHFLLEELGDLLVT